MPEDDPANNKNAVKKSNTLPTVSSVISPIFKNNSFNLITKILGEFPSPLIPKMDFKLYDNVLESLNNSYSLYSSIKPLLSQIYEINDSFLNTWKWLEDTLSLTTEFFKPTEISQEQYHQFLNNVDIFSKEGWTPDPYGNILDFIRPPEELELMFMDAVRRDGNSDLLDELIIPQMEPYQYQAILGAIHSFKSCDYYSCAATMYSLIDSLTIRYLMDLKENGIINKVAGLFNGKAVNELDRKIDQDDLNTIMYWMILKNALDYIFKSVNFENKIIKVCRDSIQHGMANEIVTKEDCVKLIFLYYNLSFFYENLKKSSSNLQYVPLIKQIKIID